MSASRPGLLRRLQESGDQAAWGRLVELCSPHLFLWACRAGLPGAAAGDLVREALTAVAGTVASFRPGAGGGFRGWLRGVAEAKRRELLRAQKVPAGGPQPGAAVDAVPAGADGVWGEEYLPLLLRTAVDLMQSEFAAQDYQIFQKVTLEGKSAVAAARELGVPPAAAYAADARVLRRLRVELDGLLD
jgi:DNA-directed RNA polymerase specialized sigma24 family protein